MFQQNYAQSHKAQVTLKLVAERLHDHITQNIWCPNSPELNALNLGSLSKWEISEYSHNTKDILKVAIVLAMTNMNQGHLIWECRRFRIRIEAIIETEGGIIEYIFQ